MCVFAVLRDVVVFCWCCLSGFTIWVSFSVCWDNGLVPVDFRPSPLPSFFACLCGRIWAQGSFVTRCRQGRPPCVFCGELQRSIRPGSAFGCQLAVQCATHQECVCFAVACSACDLLQCHMVKTVQNTCSAIMLVSIMFWILRYDVWFAVTCDLAATTTPQTPSLTLFVITVARMYGQM